MITALPGLLPVSMTADGRVIARELGHAVIHAGVDLKSKRLITAGPVPAAAA
jgi:hypothetical protein